MTTPTITNKQLEAWAGLGPWEWHGLWLHRLDLANGAETILWYTADDDGVHTAPDNAALIAAAPDLARLVLEKEKEIARLKAAALDLVSLCSADVKMNGTTYQPMPYRPAFTKAVERLIELINKDRQAMKETSDD